MTTPTLRAPYRAILVACAALCAACASSREGDGPALSDDPISRAEEAAAEDLYRSGLAAVESGDHEAALAAFTRVVDDYPASGVSGVALYWQGRTQYQLRQDAAAAATLRRYLALSPTAPFRENAALLLANSLYGTRAFEESLAAAMEVRQASPERLGAFLDLSRDLVARLARPSIERAAAAEPGRNFLVPFYLQAARWALAAGDSVGARALGRKAAALPGLPEPLVAEARALAGDTGGPPAVATRPRLGLITPTDPRFADVTELIRRGVELALEDVNRGRSTPVELVTRATPGDADSTGEVIRALARGERVEAIVGPLISESALAAATVAREEGVPLVSPTATDARLLTVDPRVFSVNALDGSIGHTIGTYATRSLERSRFAVLAVDNAYGRIQAEAFTQAVEAAGGRVAIRRDYPERATQFTDHLGAIVRAGANAVFIATKSPAEGLRILNQMAFYELGGILPLGTDAWNEETFGRQGRGFARGYFADTFSRDPRVTTWEDFAARYEARWGEAPPNLIPAWGYDATRIALESMTRGRTGGEPYRGASGLFRFGADGVRRAVVVHRIERGQPVAVEW